MEGYGVVGEEVAGSRERMERREVGDREGCREEGGQRKRSKVSSGRDETKGRKRRGGETHLRRFRRVVRSETSRFVFGPTRCQIGSS